MKDKLTYLTILFATIAVVSLIIFAKKRHKERPLKSFRIMVDTSAGNFFVNDQAIKRIIFNTDGPISRKNLHEIYISEIEKKLDTHPFIQKAEVFLTINGMLNVIVRQQYPVLRIKDGIKNYYLTKEGHPMPLSPTYAAKVILAEGPFLKEDRKKLLALISYINTDKLLKNQIIGIRKVAPNSFNLIPQIDHHIIVFGTLMDLDVKFGKLKAFYEQYPDKIKTSQYKMIHLQYKNQIVATKR
ncbi:MAG: cell division protein FtsQ/DivIB [Flavobacteriales bacterium AspAUS03]